MFSWDNAIQLQDYQSTSSDGTRDITAQKRVEVRAKNQADIRSTEHLRALNSRVIRLLDGAASATDGLERLGEQVALIRQFEVAWPGPSIGDCARRARALLSAASGLQRLPAPEGASTAAGPDPSTLLAQYLAEASALLARMPSQALDEVNDRTNGIYGRCDDEEEKIYWPLSPTLPVPDHVIDAFKILSQLQDWAADLRLAHSSETARRLREVGGHRQGHLDDPGSLGTLREAIPAIHAGLVGEHRHQRPGVELTGGFMIPPTIDPSAMDRVIADRIEGKQALLRAMDAHDATAAR